jgi:SHS2 domain-containing protein
LCAESQPSFEEIDHTADIAIRIWGRDLAELFANAARGMAQQLADVDEGVLLVEERIDLEAYDAETLLVTWLSELLYLSERDGRVFTDFGMLEVTPQRLRAIARGRPVDRRRRYIKAATFSDLEIVRTETGYQATIVFDV